jgi:hypothetical protein
MKYYVTAIKKVEIIPISITIIRLIKYKNNANQTKNNVN